MPYSAVTQPPPLPAIQRGTLSSTDAVQMTRVSPSEISAEPVALRTKPGSISTGRRSRACARARARRTVSCRHLHRRQGDALDLAERHLQEARAERAKRLDVAGAPEAVGALSARAG